MRLTGKTVLITGARSGIGRAAATALARAGANRVPATRRAERLHAPASEEETLGRAATSAFGPRLPDRVAFRIAGRTR